jgi:hypothetical protein
MSLDNEEYKQFKKELQQAEFDEMMLLSMQRKLMLNQMTLDALNHIKQLDHYSPIIDNLDVSEDKKKALNNMLVNQKYDKLEKAINKLKH